MLFAHDLEVIMNGKALEFIKLASDPQDTLDVSRQYAAERTVYHAEALYFRWIPIRLLKNILTTNICRVVSFMQKQ